MKETLDNTDNSSIYNKLLLKKILSEKKLCYLCWVRSGKMCGGENYWIDDIRKKDRNWKRFRKTQYKVGEQ